MAIADLVLLNGKVATVDHKFSFHEAVAVKDGWIIDVGTNEEIKAHVGPGTKEIDLGGKVLLPGACDAHMHAALAGMSLKPGIVHAGAPDIHSVKDLQGKIAEAVRNAKPGEWIYGNGLMDFMLAECAAEGRGLNRWDLDPVSPDNPVIINDFGLHTLVANSKALELAGIGPGFRALRVEEGSIERDENGVPNGRFGEWSAMHLVGNACPPISDEEIEACILRVQRLLNEQGATSHTDIVGLGVEGIFMGCSRQRILKIYEKLFEEGRLTARVSCHINAVMDGVESYDSVMEALEKTELPEFKDPNWVKADTIKLFGDLGSWLRDGTGRSVFPGETDEEQIAEIRRTILELHRRGWRVAMHAIGGRTIDVTVDAYAEAQEQYPREAPRHIIIHGDDLTLETAKKMGKYHICCSPQPIAANIVAGMNAPRMTAGEELFHWQAYMDMGVIVAGGSDAPCFSSNWREGVQFAVTRTTAAGQAIRPDLGMKLEDAIRMYTIEGAKQEHAEHVRGSIEVGKVADFQVLGQDIFTVPQNEIGKVPVVMTLCAGKVVYEA